MSCDVCIGGLLVQEWTDAPPDFAVCLCDAGQAWRKHDNSGRKVTPFWRIWCARWQVDPARVFMLEDIYTPQELAEVGLVKPPVNINREAALLAAVRRKPKR